MRQPGERLLSKGIFAHAWDLRDEGVDHVMGWMRDSGLNVICLAATYHSGWFLHSHNPKHKLYMTEGSRCYFRPDDKLYTNTPLRPRPASFAEETNWLSVAGDRMDRYGLSLVSWTVGAHNTDLGVAFPACAQHNAFGDSLPHALSIGHDHMREYLKALCRDLAVNYPMSGIQLESFGWMDARHGHHHERFLTELTPLEHSLLLICFNPETAHKAHTVGIDAGRAREIVVATVEAAFRNAPERPGNHPQPVAELEARSPDLAAYNSFRKRLADTLIEEIKSESLRGARCKLFVHSPYDGDLAGACDGFAVWAYGKTPDQVFAAVSEGRARIPKGWRGEYHCYVRLGMGVPSSRTQLREIVLALKQAGSTGLVFYNYSEAPIRMLGWIASALERC